MATRLQDTYSKDIRPALVTRFGYTNPMQVPKLDKIVINMGLGDTGGDTKKVDAAVGDLTMIAGQKAVITRATKSIANFKVREGLAIGGVSPKSFDGRGNYAMGIREHIIFPEINYDKVDKIRGMDIIICTTAKTNDEARELLRSFGLPFTA